MRKFVFAAATLGALFVTQIHAQVRGDSIFASGNSGTNANPVVASGDAKTNSVSGSRTDGTESVFVGFDKLAGFPINLTDELTVNTNRPAWADAQINAMFPTNVTALDKQRVAVEGFMIPLEFNGPKVTEFLLSRNPPACCFGTLPQIHELIKVQARPPGVKPMEYCIVRAAGTLHVGAERSEGILTTVYRMDADSVERVRNNN